MNAKRIKTIAVILVVATLLASPSLAHALGGGTLGSAAAGFLGEAGGDHASSDEGVAGAGDVNGDGYDDMLIGAPDNSDGGTDAGAAYLLLGGPAGWAQMGTSRGWGQGIDLGSSGVIQYTGMANDAAGVIAAGAGDVNGDGYDDMLIGAPGYNGHQGRAYLVLGSATPTNSSLSSHIQYTGEASGDYAGAGLAGAGDVNGDGYDDMLIGAYWNDSYTGAAYLILGSASPTSSALSSHVKYAGDGVVGTAGVSVAGVGDVNGDGYADLVIAALGGGGGSSYLVLGSASPTSGNLSSHIQYTGATGDIVCRVAGAGDVNGDGYTDFLVGAPGYNSSQGRAYLVLGSTAPAGGSLSSHIQYTGEAVGDEAGVSVAGAGDVNGDGYDDMLIGAYHNGDGGADAGAAYLVLGGGAPAGGSLSSHIQYTGEASGDEAGDSTAGAGDVNGDGYADLLVGAPGNDDGGADAGAAYLILSDYLAPDATPFGQRQRLWGNGGNALPVRFEQARVSVDFTSNALADGDIAVERYVFHPCNTSRRLQMPIWEIRSSKQNTYFMAPSTANLSFHYTPAQIAGMTEANLSVWSRPTGQPCAEWTDLGGTVHTISNTITIAVSGNLGCQCTIADSAPSATAVDTSSVGLNLAQGPVWPAILLLVVLAVSSGLTYWHRRRGRVMASQGMDVTDLLADKIAARLRQPPIEDKDNCRS